MNGDWTLYKWEDMFRDIYESQNKSQSAEEIWFRMIEEVSELVQPVQNQKFGTIENELPDLFAWLLAFTSKEEIDLQEALWDKFEDGCPSCGRTEGCNCLLEVDQPGRRAGSREQIQDFKQEPNNLDEWQTYFREIYGDANDELPPNLLLSKLMEDIGLVSKYLRRKRSSGQVEWKVSSVFAWIVGLCNRYSSPDGGEIKLSDITSDKYHYRCPKCGKNPCECIYLTDIFISYPGELEDEMETVKDVLEGENLNVHVFPAFRKDLSEGRVYEALSAIEESDAGVVLLGDRFSTPVFTEYHQLIHKKNRDFVFCYIHESDSEREDDQRDFIKEIRTSQMALTFGDMEELESMLSDDIHSAIETAQKLGY